MAASLGQCSCGITAHSCASTVVYSPYRPRRIPPGQQLNKMKAQEEDKKTDFILAPRAYCSLHKTDCDLGLERVDCLRKQLENRPGDLKLVIAKFGY
jgi:hypothetical protein